MTTWEAVWHLVSTGDAVLMGIISLSLYVSLTAVAIASLVGAPLGAALVLFSFPGRRMLVVLASSLMALPPVVVGLFVYLGLSRAGPLGSLGLLFTPTAMIIAQTILILPIIVALTREAVRPVYTEYAEFLRAVEARPLQRLRTVLWDARFAVITAVLAGFGRAIAEVGAVLIVGGNIAGVTRVMTTTIALETSRGNLELALALGLILIAIALSLNSLIHLAARIGARYQPSP
ncbi:MAG: ABC transporter permease [Pseudomonadota bacterium]